MNKRSQVFLRWSQSGLTLVELLIALVMGLVLLAGVVTVFVANKQTYRFQDALARLQENGRFAIALLERDIRRADANIGCTPLEFKNVLNVVKGSECGGAGDPPVGDPIHGRDNVSGYSVAGLRGGSDVTMAVKNGTDVIDIMLQNSPEAKIIEDNRPSAQMKVTSHANLRDFDVVMVVSDTQCTRAAVFQITNTNARPERDQHHIEVVHNTGRGVPGNCTKDIGPEFTGGNLIKLQYKSYFVADTGRGVPGLFLLTLPGGEIEELVEGVEDMQVLFGVDTDGDNNRTVDAYWTAAEVDSKSAAEAVNYWGRVRSARVHLLLHSVDPNALYDPYSFDLTGAFTDYHTWLVSAADKRWRQTYSTTITVRNRAP